MPLGENVSDLPLFRCCCSAVFSLLSAAVLRGKMKQTQTLGGECFKISEDERDRPGWRRGRTHLYGAFGGFAANPLHLQQKRAPGVEEGGIGRDAPACIFPANSGGTDVAL